MDHETLLVLGRPGESLLAKWHQGPGGKHHCAAIAVAGRYRRPSLVTKFERLGPELQRYDVFLDELSETARANVCYLRAERIYGDNKGKIARVTPRPIPAWGSVT